MKLNSTILFFSILSLQAFAQKITSYESADSCISTGVIAHDNEKYEEAINWYKKVSPNDPKYALALYELSLSFYYDKKYDSSVFYADKCIKENNEDLFEEVYIQKGKSLIKLEDYNAAHASYDEALKKTPKNVTLKHFKAMVYKEEKEAQKALDLMLDVNYSYSGYIKNQIEIAKMAENEGKLAQAFMAYTHAMLYSLGTDNAISVLTEIDQLASKKLREEPSNVVFSKSGDQFDEIESLLKAQISLQKDNYKMDCPIDYPVVRQLHLLMSQLEKYEPTDGYFDKYYVPFYKEVYKNGNFNELIALMFLTYNEKNVQSYIKKNDQKIAKFLEWAQTYLAKGVNKRQIEVNGKSLTLPCIFRKGIKSCGELNAEDKKDGIWYYFFPSGNLERFGPVVNDDTEGKWEYFYENGKKRAEYTFVKEMKDGPYFKYYENGNMKESGSYKMDSLEGEQIAYYENQNIQTKGNFINNKKEGLWQLYYKFGNLKVEANFKEDKNNGEYTYYAIDGKSVLNKFNYVNDLKDGLQIEYYDNGNKRVETRFNNGKRDGEYKEYFVDGTLAEESSYENNIHTSEKDYHFNGNLATVYGYKKGELESKEIYDYDGKLFSKYLFKDDYLKSVITYDISGNEVSKQSVGKNDEFVGKWYYTGKSSNTGGYKKGKAHGAWTNFNLNGTKDNERNYELGVQTGLQKSYNEEGQLTSEYQMADDMKNGYYRTFYPSGELQKEGWYLEDNQVGYWYEYYIDGTLKEETYYVEGESNGKNIEYDPDGKLSSIYNFKSDRMLSYENYDRDGSLLFKTDITGASNKLKPFSKMEFASYKRDRKYGYNDGEYYSEPVAGVFDYKGFFTAGTDNGLYSKYYKNGNKSRSLNMKFGESQGLDTSFYVNGIPYYTTSYEVGNEYYKFNRYYYTGQVWIDRKVLSNRRDSVETHFGINGEMILKKYYKLGYLDYIIRNNSSGELNDTMKVENGTIDYEAKFKNGTLAIKESIKLGEVLQSQVYSDQNILLHSYETDEFGLLKLKTFFYANGKPLSKEEFNKGQSIKDQFYREDGTLWIEDNFKHDIQHGSSKLFDESGAQKLHLIYRNGVAYELGN